MTLSDNETWSGDEDAAHEEFIPSYRVEVDFETWCDYWSEELAITWHVTKDQCSNFGYPLFDRCTFAQFAEFAYAHSSKFPPKC